MHRKYPEGEAAGKMFGWKNSSGPILSIQNRPQASPCKFVSSTQGSLAVLRRLISMALPASSALFYSPEEICAIMPLLWLRFHKAPPLAVPGLPHSCGLVWR